MLRAVQSGHLSDVWMLGMAGVMGRLRDTERGDFGRRWTALVGGGTTWLASILLGVAFLIMDHSGHD